MVTPPMPIMRMFMTKLQNINPRGFQFVDEAIKSGGNPIGIWQQLSSKMDPNQIQGILNNAGQYGCPQSIINQFQGINKTLKDKGSQSEKVQDNKPN